MTCSILILDGERLSRTLIRNMAEKHLPDAIIYDTGSTGKALGILADHAIDVLFLEAKMPEMSGFDFLEMVPWRSFEVIFITAHTDYAVNAVKVHALDYLLKPIQPSEFLQCLHNITEKLKSKTQRHLAPPTHNYLDKKLSVNHQTGVKFLYLKDLIYLEAKNSYTTLHLGNDSKITVAKSISLFEAKLDNRYFFRIHRSSIVNLCHCAEFVSHDGGMIIMSNGHRLHISKSRQNELLEVMTSHYGALQI